MGYRVAIREIALFRHKAHGIPTVVRISGELKAVVNGRRAAGAAPEVNAGFAEALHGHEVDAETRPLCSVSGSACAGSAKDAAGSQHGLL